MGPSHKPDPQFAVKVPAKEDGVAVGLTQDSRPMSPCVRGSRDVPWWKPLSVCSVYNRIQPGISGFPWASELFRLEKKCTALSLEGFILPFVEI